MMANELVCSWSKMAKGSVQATKQISGDHSKRKAGLKKAIHVIRLRLS